MHEPLHHRAATGSFERQELLRQLDRHLSETLRNSIFDVLDADRIDSVALVRLSLRLAIEYVAQVRGAPIAYDLEATSVSEPRRGSCRPCRSTCQKRPNRNP